MYYRWKWRKGNSNKYIFNKRRMRLEKIDNLVTDFPFFVNAVKIDVHLDKNGLHDRMSVGKV
jgi:hypothetical protein